ncbi:MAG: sulfotransferase domain-containing protein [Alphaproteobacteria bacterium]|nr:sulfotransferase domain-containing protein [Alphaproteobacteria bacterium]
MMTTADLTLDFAIAGVQKAGTTALAQYLGQNPEIYLPPTKETHYFRRAPTAGRPADRPFSHLTRHFADAPQGALLGDATPVYLYWPNALELLQAHNQALRIVISLRHPVARAYSAWSMQVRRGRETLSFGEAIRDGRERVRQSPFGVDLFYSYVERGFYSNQMARLYSLFPKAQVFVLRSDDIRADSPVLGNLQSFLGAAPCRLTPLVHNVQPGSLPAPPGLAADFEYLQGVFEKDMHETAILTGLDLADWMACPPPVPELDLL